MSADLGDTSDIVGSSNFVLMRYPSSQSCQIRGVRSAPGGHFGRRFCKYLSSRSSTIHVRLKQDKMIRMHPRP